MTDTSATHAPLNADIQWDEHGLPIAEHFGDFYFSRADGLAETRYVYIEQNRLAERWQQLNAQQPFIIGETGFGTGLNFLATWQRWAQEKQALRLDANAQLHFISVEKYPLKWSDLRRALALWPELAGFTEQLLGQYPTLCSGGFHRLNFGDISLTLIIDEAVDGFEQLLASHHPAFDQPSWHVDAWYLDGFSPAKNPDMWHPALFERVKKLSGPQTTLATFAATRVIKEQLQANGFEVEKPKGFGLKREMIRAHVIEPYQPQAATEFEEHAYNAPFSAPWASRSVWVSNTPPSQTSAQGHEAKAEDTKRILIVGAGLAGCHTAAALAAKGWQVTLVDQHEGIASEASGNPQGIVYAKLSHKAETLADFNLDALQHAQRHYRPYWQDTGGNIGQQCGVLQLSHTDKVATQHGLLADRYAQAHPEQQLLQPVTQTEASELSGLPQSNSGLFFPQSGWLNPRALCQALIKHPNITLRTGLRVTALVQENRGWRVAFAEAAAHEYFPSVVLCCASHVKSLAQSEHLPVKPIRGQVTYSAATAASQQLKTVLCADGYIAPATQKAADSEAQQHCLGASFSLKNPTLALCEEEQRENLQRLQAHFPSVAEALEIEADKHPLQGRAARRCTTPDYLPMVGPAPNMEGYLEDFALLRKNARASIPRPGANWPNLYINIGHGSRGLTYTPLCAEVLAAQINHEPLPCSRHLQVALHPARFLIRGLIRKKL